METTQEKIDQIQKSLMTMYRGNVSSELSDDATRWERTQVAEDYNNLLQILADLRKE